MFRFLGLDSCLETIACLSHRYFQGDSDRDNRRAYLRYLSSIQPEIPQPIDGKLDFEYRPHSIDSFVRAFNENSRLTDKYYRLEPNSEVELGLRVAEVKRHYQQISKDIPQFKALCDLVVHTVFIAPSEQAGGGTTSSAIGVIWANPRGTWSHEDHLEFFIHEVTHTLMFLDERRYTHYTQLRAALDQANWAESAILGQRRPTDKALHSLVVATEVLLYRESQGWPELKLRLHPPTDMLLKGAVRSAESLSEVIKNRKVLSDRGVWLVQRCKAELLRITNNLYAAKGGQSESNQRVIKI